MRANLQYFFNAFGVFAVIVVLFCSFFIEFFGGERPCILCFLQRAAMLGTAVAFWFNFITGIQIRNYAMALAWILFGLFVGLRHAAYNVCYEVADPLVFLSYRLYTWSIFVFFSCLIGLVVLLFLYKPVSKKPSRFLTLFSGALLIISLGICFGSSFFLG